MHTFMELTVISIESERLFKKNKTWRVDGMGFRLEDADVQSNGPQMEEQLWSFRNGLSDIVYTIDISEKRYSKLLSKRNPSTILKKRVKPKNRA